MTELERATQAYCQEHNDDCFEAIGDECPYIGKAFKAGAEWQKKQSAKKAVELFLNYCEVWGYTDYYAVEEFRKEMEK